MFDHFEGLALESLKYFVLYISSNTVYDFSRFMMFSILAWDSTINIKTTPVTVVTNVALSHYFESLVMQSCYQTSLWPCGITFFLPAYVWPSFWVFSEFSNRFKDPILETCYTKLLCHQYLDIMAKEFYIICD